MNGGSWISCCRKQLQNHRHDFALHRSIPGLATRVAEREIGEEETGDATLFDDVTGGAEDDGGDTVIFQMTSDQTNCLVADWSERDEEGDIDLILETIAQDGRGCFLTCLTLAVFGRCAVETRG